MSQRQPSSQACLLLGSNILLERNLSKAIELLGLHAEIEGASLGWETPAVGSDVRGFRHQDGCKPRYPVEASHAVRYPSGSDGFDR